ncbi:terminase small subunit [Mycolicibacterium sp. A43C]
MTEGTTQEESKDKGGRPLKFQSVQQLTQKIEQYFGDCDSHEATRKVFVKKADASQYLSEEQYLTEQQPYTVNGLAYALDTSRAVLVDYESGKYDEKAEDADETGERFSNAIKRAKARIAMDVERRTMSGATPAAAGIFWLKNNNGWKDKLEHDHTSDGKRIEAPSIYMSTIAPRDPEDATAQDEAS